MTLYIKNNMKKMNLKQQIIYSDLLNRGRSSAFAYDVAMGKKKTRKAKKKEKPLWEVW